MRDSLNTMDLDALLVVHLFRHEVLENILPLIPAELDHVLGSTMLGVNDNSSIAAEEFLEIFHNGFRLLISQALYDRDPFPCRSLLEPQMYIMI